MQLRNQKSILLTKLFFSMNHFETLVAFYTLSGRIGKVVASHAEGCRVDSWLRLHRFILCTRRSGGTAMRAGGATGHVDLPSLTPLSVAGCGRLQLGVPRWAASVDYCK